MSDIVATAIKRKKFYQYGNFLYDCNGGHLEVLFDGSLAAWNTQAFQRMLTVSGVVRLKMTAVCELTPTSAGGTATIKLGTYHATAPVDFIPAGDTVATLIETGQLFCGSLSADNLRSRSADNAVIDKVVNGDNVGITVATQNLTAGKIRLYVDWEAISDGANVLAGAGEAN